MDGSLTNKQQFNERMFKMAKTKLDKIADDHRENVEECKNIFVTWQWTIGIIVTVIAGVAALTYAAGVKISNTETGMDKLNNDNVIIHHRIDGIDKRIGNDIDTIKSMLRERK